MKRTNLDTILSFTVNNNFDSSNINSFIDNTLLKNYDNVKYNIQMYPKLDTTTFNHILSLHEIMFLNNELDFLGLMFNVNDINDITIRFLNIPIDVDFYNREIVIEDIVYNFNDFLNISFSEEISLSSVFNSYYKDIINILKNVIKLYTYNILVYKLIISDDTSYLYIKDVLNILVDD